MGAEALCRGAATVVGIEQNAKACGVIKQNWQQVATPEQSYQVIKGDVRGKVKTLQGGFELIYFDPPYATGLYQPILEAIALHDLLTSDGEIAVEHSPKQWEAIEIAGLEICRQKSYGNTSLTFYQPSL